MAYFVTGATGFIGRHLVEELLKRDDDVYVLVREGSLGRLDELTERWGQAPGRNGARGRVKLVVGDLGVQMLVLPVAILAALSDHIVPYIHLASILAMYT